MKFLLGAFAEIWANFYNSVIRDASSSLKGGIILGLFVCVCLCLVFAMKGDKKADKFVHNWFLFWLGIVALALLVTYVCLI